MRQKTWWPTCVALALLVAGLSCSEQEQAQFATQVAMAGATSVSVIQTEGPPLQTQMAIAGATSLAMAQTQSLPLQTQVAQAALTAMADLTAQIPNPLPTARAATPAATAPPQKQPVIDYFALGDSLASGHGLQDDSTECHVSLLGYPMKVVTHLSTRYDAVNWEILACSGATIKKPTDKTLLQQYPDKWFRNQVDYVVEHLSDRPTLVTLTIGANDFGWADLLGLAPHLVQPADEYVAWLQSVGTSIKTELVTQLPRLLSHPNVVVVMTLVPNPFNRESVYFSWTSLDVKPCQDLFGTATCFQRSEYLVTWLNSAVSDTYGALKKKSANVGFVGKFAVKFDAHRAPSPSCGTEPPTEADTWVQYPGDPKSNGPVPRIIALKLGHSYGDCIHPNEEGAQAFADDINETADRLLAALDTPPAPGSQITVLSARETLKAMAEMQSPWRQVTAPIQNAPGQRSAGAYANVIDQFDVAAPELAGRYQAGGSDLTDTRCNIFAGDVMRAMGVPLPTKGNLGKGQGAAGSAYTDPMTAQADLLNDYLNQKLRWVTSAKDPGVLSDWKEIDPTTAGGLSQLIAHVKAGKPALVSDPGHIAVIRPEQVAVKSWPALTIAQAGATNFLSDPLQGHFYGTPQFFIHD